MKRIIASFLVIRKFEFRICFVFRASDFEFTGKVKPQKTKTYSISDRSGKDIYKSNI